jgi:NitT/TauT family transport system permease protein
VTDALIAEQPTVSQRRGVSLRGLWFGLIALAAAIAVWESYKLVGPKDHVGTVFGWKVIPRANATSMPHVVDMLKEFGEPEVRGSGTSVLGAVSRASLTTFLLALTGLVLGVLFGMFWAVLMARFSTLRRGLMPYLVISQTVPLIALAPLTVNWGGQLEFGGFEWQKWMSVLLLGAFLAFFPIAVGGLRGLLSPKPEAVELMNSYAASWWQGLRRLRLPSAVPFLMPALRLAGGAAVFGVIVSEISVGYESGVGRLVLAYSQEATSRPAKFYTAVFGAIVVGLAIATLLSFVDRAVFKNRPSEDPA